MYIYIYTHGICVNNYLLKMKLLMYDFLIAVIWTILIIKMSEKRKTQKNSVHTLDFWGVTWKFVCLQCIADASSTIMSPCDTWYRYTCRFPLCNYFSMKLQWSLILYERGRKMCKALHKTVQQKLTIYLIYYWIHVHCTCIYRYISL